MFPYSRFEKLCKKKGVTPNQVSIATGVPTSALTNWKNKYTREDVAGFEPKADKILLIANYFGVPLEYFIEKPKKE